MADIKEYTIRIKADVKEAQAALDTLAQSASKLDDAAKIEQSLQKAGNSLKGSLGKIKTGVNQIQASLGTINTDNLTSELQNASGEISELQGQLADLSQTITHLSQNSNFTSFSKDMLASFEELKNTVTDAVSSFTDLAGAMQDIQNGNFDPDKLFNLDKLTELRAAEEKSLKSALAEYASIGDDKIYDDKSSLQDLRAYLKVLNQIQKSHNKINNLNKKIEAKGGQSSSLDAIMGDVNIEDVSDGIDFMRTTVADKRSQQIKARAQKSIDKSEPLTIQSRFVLKINEDDEGNGDSIVNSIVNKIEGLKDKIQGRVEKMPIRIPLGYTTEYDSENMTDDEIREQLKKTDKQQDESVITSLNLKIDADTSNLKQKINDVVKELNQEFADIDDGPTIKVKVKPIGDKEAVEDLAADATNEIRKQSADRGQDALDVSSPSKSQFHMAGSSDIEIASATVNIGSATVNIGDVGSMIAGALGKGGEGAGGASGGTTAPLNDNDDILLANFQRQTQIRGRYTKLNAKKADELRTREAVLSLMAYRTEEGAQMNTFRQMITGKKGLEDLRKSEFYTASVIDPKTGAKIAKYGAGQTVEEWQSGLEKTFLLYKDELTKQLNGSTIYDENGNIISEGVYTKYDRMMKEPKAIQYGDDTMFEWQKTLIDRYQRQQENALKSGRVSNYIKEHGALVQERMAANEGMTATEAAEALIKESFQRQIDEVRRSPNITTDLKNELNRERSYEVGRVRAAVLGNNALITGSGNVGELAFDTSLASAIKRNKKAQESLSKSMKSSSFIENPANGKTKVTLSNGLEVDEKTHRILSGKSTAINENEGVNEFNRASQEIAKKAAEDRKLAHETTVAAQDDLDNLQEYIGLYQKSQQTQEAFQKATEVSKTLEAKHLAEGTLSDAELAKLKSANDIIERVNEQGGPIEMTAKEIERMGALQSILASKMVTPEVENALKESKRLEAKSTERGFSESDFEQLQEYYDIIERGARDVTAEQAMAYAQEQVPIAQRLVEASKKAEMSITKKARQAQTQIAEEYFVPGIQTDPKKAEADYKYREKRIAEQSKRLAELRSNMRVYEGSGSYDMSTLTSEEQNEYRDLVNSIKQMRAAQQAYETVYKNKELEGTDKTAGDKQQRIPTQVKTNLGLDDKTAAQYFELPARAEDFSQLTTEQLNSAISVLEESKRQISERVAERETQDYGQIAREQVASDLDAMRKEYASNEKKLQKLINEDGDKYQIRELEKRNTAIASSIAQLTGDTDNIHQIAKLQTELKGVIKEEEAAKKVIGNATTKEERDAAQLDLAVMQKRNRDYIAELTKQEEAVQKRIEASKSAEKNEEITKRLNAPVVLDENGNIVSEGVNAKYERMVKQPKSVDYNGETMFEWQKTLIDRYQRLEANALSDGQIESFIENNSNLIAARVKNRKGMTAEDAARQLIQESFQRQIDEVRRSSKLTPELKAELQRERGYEANQISNSILGNTEADQAELAEIQKNKQAKIASAAAEERKAQQRIDQMATEEEVAAAKERQVLLEKQGKSLRKQIRGLKKNSNLGSRDISYAVSEAQQEYAKGRREEIISQLSSMYGGDESKAFFNQVVELANAERAVLENTDETIIDQLTARRDQLQDAFEKKWTGDEKANGAKFRDDAFAKETQALVDEYFDLGDQFFIPEEGEVNKRAQKTPVDNREVKTLADRRVQIKESQMKAQDQVFKMTQESIDERLAAAKKLVQQRAADQQEQDRIDAENEKEAQEYAQRQAELDATRQAEEKKMSKMSAAKRIEYVQEPYQKRIEELQGEREELIKLRDNLSAKEETEVSPTLSGEQIDETVAQIKTGKKKRDELNKLIEKETLEQAKNQERIVELNDLIAQGGEKSKKKDRRQAEVETLTARNAEIDANREKMRAEIQKIQDDEDLPLETLTAARDKMVDEIDVLKQATAVEPVETDGLKKALDNDEELKRLNELKKTADERRNTLRQSVAAAENERRKNRQEIDRLQAESERRGERQQEVEKMRSRAGKKDISNLPTMQEFNEEQQKTDDQITALYERNQEISKSLPQAKAELSDADKEAVARAKDVQNRRQEIIDDYADNLSDTVLELQDQFIEAVNSGASEEDLFALRSQYLGKVEEYKASGQADRLSYVAKTGKKIGYIGDVPAETYARNMTYSAVEAAQDNLQYLNEAIDRRKAKDSAVKADRDASVAHLNEQIDDINYEIERYTWDSAFVAQDQIYKELEKTTSKRQASKYLNRIMHGEVTDVDGKKVIWNQIDDLIDFAARGDQGVQEVLNRVLDGIAVFEDKFGEGYYKNHAKIGSQIDIGEGKKWYSVKQLEEGRKRFVDQAQQYADGIATITGINDEVDQMLSDISRSYQLTSSISSKDREISKINTELATLEHEKTVPFDKLYSETDEQYQARLATRNADIEAKITEQTKKREQAIEAQSEALAEQEKVQARISKTVEDTRKNRDMSAYPEDESERLAALQKNVTARERAYDKLQKSFDKTTDKKEKEAISAQMKKAQSDYASSIVDLMTANPHPEDEGKYLQTLYADMFEKERAYTTARESLKNTTDDKEREKLSAQMKDAQSEYVSSIMGLMSVNKDAFNPSDSKLRSQLSNTQNVIRSIIEQQKQEGVEAYNEQNPELVQADKTLKGIDKAIASAKQKQTWIDQQYADAKKRLKRSKEGPELSPTVEREPQKPKETVDRKSASDAIFNDAKDKFRKETAKDYKKFYADAAEHNPWRSWTYADMTEDQAIVARQIKEIKAAEKKNGGLDLVSQAQLEILQERAKGLGLEIGDNGKVIPKVSYDAFMAHPERYTIPTISTDKAVAAGFDEKGTISSAAIQEITGNVAVTNISDIGSAIGTGLALESTQQAVLGAIRSLADAKGDGKGGKGSGPRDYEAELQKTPIDSPQYKKIINDALTAGLKLSQKDGKFHLGKTGDEELTKDYMSKNMPKEKGKGYTRQLTDEQQALWNKAYNSKQTGMFQKGSTATDAEREEFLTKWIGSGMGITKRGTPVLKEKRIDKEETEAFAKKHGIDLSKVNTVNVSAGKATVEEGKTGDSSSTSGGTSSSKKGGKKKKSQFHDINTALQTKDDVMSEEDFIKRIKEGFENGGHLGRGKNGKIFFGKEATISGNAAVEDLTSQYKDNEEALHGLYEAYKQAASGAREHAESARESGAAAEKAGDQVREAGEKTEEGGRQAEESGEKQKSSGKKFKDYSEDVALGMERIEKGRILEDVGYSMAETADNNHVLAYKMASANDELWEMLKSKGFLDKEKFDPHGMWPRYADVEDEYIDQFLQKHNLTKDQIRSQLAGIESIVPEEVGFKPAMETGNSQEAWQHYHSTDENGHFTDNQMSDVPYTYKAYARFTDPRSLNAENVGSIMKALSKAGFKGQVKVPGADVGRFITSSDQLVIHGVSQEMQELAYNILKDQFGNLFSSIQAGFDKNPDKVKHGPFKDNASFSEIVTSKEREGLLESARGYFEEQQGGEETPKGESKENEYASKTIDELKAAIKKKQSTLKRQNLKGETRTRLNSEISQLQAELDSRSETEPEPEDEDEGMSAELLKQMQDLMAKQTQLMQEAQSADTDEKKANVKQKLAQVQSSMARLQEQFNRMKDEDEKEGREEKEETKEEKSADTSETPADTSGRRTSERQTSGQQTSRGGKRKSKYHDINTALYPKNETLLTEEEFMEQIKQGFEKGGYLGRKENGQLFFGTKKSVTEQEGVEDVTEQYKNNEAAVRGLYQAYKKAAEAAKEHAESAKKSGDATEKAGKQAEESGEKTQKAAKEEKAADEEGTTEESQQKRKRLTRKQKKQYENTIRQKEQKLEDDSLTDEQRAAVVSEIRDIARQFPEGSNIYKKYANEESDQKADTTDMKAHEGAVESDTAALQGHADAVNADTQEEKENTGDKKKPKKAPEDKEDKEEKNQKKEKKKKDDDIVTEATAKPQNLEEVRAVLKAAGIDVSDNKHGANLIENASATGYTYTDENNPNGIYYRFKEATDKTPARHIIRQKGESVYYGKLEEQGQKMIDSFFERYSTDEFLEYMPEMFRKKDKQRVADLQAAMRQLQKNGILSADDEEIWGEKTRNNPNALGYKSYEDYVKGVRSTLIQYNKEIAKYRKSTDKIDTGEKVSQGVVSVKEDLENYVNGLDDASAKIIKFSKNNQELTYTLRTADDQLETHVLSVDKTGSIFDQMIDSTKYLSPLQTALAGLGDKFKELFRYFVASVSIREAFQYFQQMISMVTEMDTAMTNLQKVTEGTGEEFDKFKEQAFDLAKETGSTATSVVDAATEWARLGYSLDEAGELSKASLIYSNVGELDAVTATTDLVSALKAFKIDSSDVMSVVDVLNEIGNNYAISSGQLGEVLEKSSSSLAVSGDDLAHVSAMAAAMNEVIQDSSVTGSTLKVVGLRLRGAKTELTSMDEDTEGMVTSTPKLRSQIMALTAVNGNKGFDIMKDPKNFKSTYDILKGIADVWEDMSQIDQAALLELIAGKNRAQGAAALISNFEQAENALRDAQAAEGSAEEENMKYVNSIEGRMKLFKNQLQELANVTLESGTIKGFVDAGTVALSVITNIVDKMGGLKTIIASIAAIIQSKSGLGFLKYDRSKGGFVSGGFMEAVSPLFSRTTFNTSETGKLFGMMDNNKSYSSELARLANEGYVIPEEMHDVNRIQNYAAAVTTVGEASEYFAKTTSGFRVAIQNIGDGFKTIAANVGINLAITMAIELAVKLISYLATIKARIKEAGEAAQKNIKEVRDETEKRDNFLKDNLDEYLSLRSKVNGNSNRNFALADDDYEKYIELTNELAELMPELVTGWDAQGNAILGLSANIDTAKQSIEDLVAEYKILDGIAISENLGDEMEYTLQQIKDLDKEKKKEENYSEEHTNEATVEDFLNNRFSFSDKEQEDAIIAALKQLGITSYVSSFDESGSGGFINIVLDDGTGSSAAADIINNLTDAKIKKAFADNGVVTTSQEGKKAKTKANALQTQMDQIWSGQAKDIMGSFQDNPEFNELSDNMQFLLSQQIQNLDPTELTKVNTDNWETYFEDEYLTPMLKAMSKVKDKDKLDSMITKMMSEEYDDNETVDSLRDKVEKDLNKILPGDEMEPLRQMIKIGLEFEYEDEDHNIVAKTDDVTQAVYDALGVEESGSHKITKAQVDSTLTSRQKELFIQGIGDDTTKIFDNYQAMDIGELSEAIGAYEKLQEKLLEGTGRLQEFFASDRFDDSEYTSRLSAATTALETLKENGELTSDERIDLRKSFPELPEVFNANDIKNAATDVLEQYITGLIDAGEDFGLSDKDMKKLRAYAADNVESNSEVISKSARGILYSTLGTRYGYGADVHVEEFENALGEERLNDKNAAAIMMQLQADGTLAEGTIEEIVAAWDNYAIHFNIVADDEDIVNLQKQIESRESQNATAKAREDFKERSGIDLPEEVQSAMNSIQALEGSRNVRAKNAAKNNLQDVMDKYGIDSTIDLTMLDEVGNWDTILENDAQNVSDTLETVKKKWDKYVKSEKDETSDEYKEFQSAVNDYYDALNSQIDDQLEADKSGMSDITNSINDNQMKAKVLQDEIDNTRAKGQRVDEQTTDELGDLYTSLAKGQRDLADAWQKNAEKYAPGTEGFNKDLYEASIQNALDASDAARDFQEQAKEAYSSYTNDQLDLYKNNMENLQNAADDLQNSLVDTTIEQKVPIYFNLAINSELQKQNIKAQRQAVIEEFNKKNEQYKLDNDGMEIPETSQDFLDYKSTLHDLDEQLRNTTNSQMEFIQSLAQIPVDRLTKQLDAYRDSLNQMQQEQGLKEATGRDVTTADYMANATNLQQQANTQQQGAKILNGLGDLFERAGKRDFAKQLKDTSKEWASDAMSSAISAQQEMKKAMDAMDDQYEKELSRLQTSATDYQNVIDMTTSTGNLAAEQDYQNLINNASQQVDQYERMIGIRKGLMNAMELTNPDYADNNFYIGWSQDISNFQGDIDNLVKSQDEWKRSIEELPIQRLGQDMVQLQNDAQKAQNKIAQMQADGEKVTAQQYVDLVKNADFQRTNQEKQIAIWENIAASRAQEYGIDSTYYTDAISEINNLNSAITELQTNSVEWTLMANGGLELADLNDEMTLLSDKAAALNEIMTLNDAKGLKPTVDNYKQLAKLSDQQVDNLKEQNVQLRKERSALVDVYGENAKNLQSYKDINAQLLQNRNQIRQAEADSIAYESQARRLAVTQVQDLSSAISSALSENGTLTGVSNDTIDSLMKNFSDLAGVDVSTMFYRTADGVKADTRAMQQLFQAENKMKSAQFSKEIEAQKQEIKELQDALGEGVISQELDRMNAELQDRLRQQAEYFAQYEETMKQFSDFNAIALADSTTNAGANFDAAANYLKEAKEMYDKGLIGTDDFKARAAYFNYNGFDDPESFIADYNKLSGFFTEDGITGMKKFVNELVNEGLATFNQEANAYEFDFDTMEDAAAKFKGGVGVGLFEDTINKLSDYGFDITFVSSLEEAELKTEELANELADAKLKYGDLMKAGADQSVLDKQQAVIDGIKGRLKAVTTEAQHFAEGVSESFIEDFKNVDDEINYLAKQYKKAKMDTEKLRLKQQIEAEAEEYGIKLNADLTVNEKSYDEVRKELGIRTREDALTAEETGLVHEHGNGATFKNFDHVTDLVAEGLESTDQTVKDAFTTLSKYTSDELKQIQMNNGVYEEGFEEAERAMDKLTSAFGLTAEEADVLAHALQAMFVTKDLQEGDTSDLTTESAREEHMAERNAGRRGAKTTQTEEGKKEYQYSWEAQNEAQDHTQYSYAEELAAKAEAEAAAAQEAAIKAEEFQANKEQQQPIIDATNAGSDKVADAVYSSADMLAGKIDGKDDEPVAKSDLTTGSLKDELITEKNANAHGTTPTTADGENFANLANSVNNLADTSEDGNDDVVQELSGINSTLEAGQKQEQAQEKFTEGTSTASEATVKGETSTAEPAKVQESAPIQKPSMPSAPTEPTEDLEDKVVNVSYETDTSELEAANAGIKDQEENVTFTADTGDLDAAEADAKTPIEKVVNFVSGVISTITETQAEPVTEEHTTEENTIITVEADTSAADSAIEEVKANAEESPIMTIDGDNSPAKSKADQAKTYIDGLTSRITIDGDASAAISAADSAVANINSMSGEVSVTADTSTIVSDINNALSSGDFIVDVTAQVTGTIMNVSVANSTSSSSLGTDAARAEKFYTGTVIPAHASGTAYNVINMIPMGKALAGGTNDVTIQKNENSLVNELGQESLIRNGKWFLLPGGMHVESLKKGDKILVTPYGDIRDKIYLIAGKPLELYKLQHKNEIRLSAIV